MTNCTNAQIKENRDNLIKALESGEYKKGRTSLRDINDEYCCLGVMCEVLAIKPELNGAKSTYCYEGKLATAPEKVIREFGLYSEFGNAIDDKKTLTEINDTNYTFHPVIEALKSGKFWKELD